MNLKEFVTGKIDYASIPQHMVEQAKMYIEHGIDPGSFLSAVLCNDLFEALCCADDINILSIGSYKNFLLTIPMAAKGSYQAFDKWCQHSGLAGLENENDDAQEDNTEIR